VETSTLHSLTSNGGLIGNGTKMQPVDLPREVRDLAATVPANLYGLPKLHWYAERINAWPDKLRNEVLELFNGFVRIMLDLDASDLDAGGLSSKGMMWYRVDGLKQPRPELGVMTQEETNVVLLNLLFEPQQEKLFENYSIDFGTSLDLEDGTKARRFRTTLFMENRHLALSQRMLAWKPRPIKSLKFHPLIERGMMFRYLRDGLILITGVTGSGKSTTLDSIIDANNEDIEAQIIMVAQPLEYLHESKKCIVRQREVGTDVANYVDGMVQALRQDPDIVIIGEMRDAESISTAMELSDTGHKVFSTLHTGSAIETVDRIVAEYSPVEQDRIRYRLADVLRCIVSQKLLPAIGGGRVLAKEVMWMTPSARAAIKNNNTSEIYQMMWSSADQGQMTLEQDLFRLFHDGDISQETAINYANNKRRLLQMIR